MEFETKVLLFILRVKTSFKSAKIILDGFLQGELSDG